MKLDNMLKRIKKVRLYALLAMSLIGGMSSCIFDHYPEDAVDNPFAASGNDSPVNLELSMQLPYLPAETRAAELPTAEHVRDLRVVIVSLPVDSRGLAVAGEEPLVEVNMLISSPPFTQKGICELLFEKIIPDRLKKIYFFANCEQTCLDIRDASGAPLDLGAAAAYLPTAGGQAPVEECTFLAPTGQYGEAYVPGSAAAVTDYGVPVTAVHELTIPTLDEMRALAGSAATRLVCRVNKPLYLVRAVNKINVTIENNTGTTPDAGGNHFIDPVDVRLTSFSLTKINTGKSYLLAHLDTDDPLFDPYQPSAAERARPVYARNDLNPAWMRWVATEAEKTQSGADVVYEWLTAYDMPAPVVNVETQPQRFFAGEAEEGWLSSTREPESGRSYPTRWTTPAVYFPETLYIPADATEQEYMLTCTFEQRTSGGTVKEITHTAVLPRLKSLFRNTHVLVNFSVTDNADVSLDLEVLPWATAPEEEWHYSRTVGIADNGFIEWEQVEHDNTRDCRLVLKPDGTASTGTFTIASPINDEWCAYLIPLTGDPDAFMFVAEDGETEITRPHGIIDGTPAQVRIRQRYATTSEQNTAKLQIMVRTADNRFMEADVCKGEPAYYTIIQNRNSF